MFQEPSFTKSGNFPALLIILVGAHFAAGAIVQQLPSGTKSQISQQAAYVSTQPAKVSVKVLTQEITVGSKLQAEITVLNAENHPIAAKDDWGCETSIRFPSGKSSSHTVSIKKGQTSTQFEFLAEEAGLASVLVQPLWGAVRSDRVEVIVRPARKSLKKKKMPRGGLNPSALHDYLTVQQGRIDEVNAQLKTAAFGLPPGGPSRSQAPESHGQTSSSVAVLHISINDPDGNYRANGEDAAVISAVFESPDLSPAPTDIHIWFHWTRGLLDPPQPLQISKGAFSTTAYLTSKWPGNVHLNFVSSTPPYQAQGETDFIIHFVPLGAALVGPDKLSVVDNTPIMIVFYDAQQNPVAPGKNWPVTLRSKQSRLHFAPQSFEVQGTSPIGSAVLFPVSWGNDTVEAIVADYTLQPKTILITGWMVLALCLAGGIAGGLAAYNKFKGSWIWRIFLGILGGALLCWLYVYLALPNVNVNIAHNTFSVFFVALIGGYGGTSILDLAAKRLGWIGT